MANEKRRISRFVLAICLLPFVVCHLPFRCAAETPQDLFQAGNAAYAEGKFAVAVEKYQAASEQGLRHWVLEYNLGNAYYRAGQLGRSIVHYERAFRLNSGQRDVLYNLNLASTKAGDPVLPTSALPALAWRLFYFISLNTLTVLTSILFLLLVLHLAVIAGLPGIWGARPSDAIAPNDRSPRFLQSLALTARGAFLVPWMLGLLALSMLWLGARIYLLEQREGVVVTSVAEVRSGPNTTYPASFTVPEGRRVLILEEVEPIQGWIEIGVPQEGLKGWVPESAIEIL